MKEETVRHAPLDRPTLKRLYQVQGWTARDIGDHFGLDHRTILYHLRRFGIPVRPRTRRSALRIYKTETLLRGIREKGLRGYAREIGVPEGTLRYYLKTLKEKGA